MNREQVLNMFNEKIIIEENFKYFLKTDEHCKEIKEVVTERLLKSYIELYKKINYSNKKNIHSINAQLLRTGVYSREYDLLISAYDKEWYLEKNSIYVSVDVKDVFKYLNEFEDEMIIKTKKYVGIISHVDIIGFKQKALEKHMNYINHIVREAVNRSIETDAFKDLNRNEIFNFYVGEYKGKFSLIKRIDDSNKDEVKIREEFHNLDKQERLTKNSTHFDFKDLNLKDMDFRFYNLNYSSFRGLKITRSNLSECSLCGCDFRECDLEEATIIYSLICDSNFQGANLSKVQFKKSIAEISKPTFEKQYVMGFWGTNFQNTNLVETDFSQCDLKGADFRGGIFKNTNFKGANLKNSKFFRKDIGSLGLDLDQIYSVEWI